MGLRVQIFKWSLGDCTKKGMSSTCDALTLINVEGPFEPTPDAPAAKLLLRKTGNAIIRPADIPPNKWTMSGGNFAYTSDTRFCEALRLLTGYAHSFPVSIHDRVEN